MPNWPINLSKLLAKYDGLFARNRSCNRRSKCDTPRRNPELILIVLASYFELLRVPRKIRYAIVWLAQQTPSKAFLTVKPIQ